MGFLSQLFGGKPDYPHLAADAPAAGRLDQIRASLESLASESKEPLEIVPAENGAFIYLGKPPKRFAVAWVENGKLQKIKAFAEEHRLSPSELTAMYEKLRLAYERHQDEPRYLAEVAGHDIVVIPSEGLEADVKGIISTAIH